MNQVEDIAYAFDRVLEKRLAGFAVYSLSQDALRHHAVAPAAVPAESVPDAGPALGRYGV